MRNRCINTSMGALCALIGCTFGGDIRQTDGASAAIGPDGGSVAMSGGPTLEIPAGALANTTTITITRSSAQADGALSPVYQFGPDGMTFSKPVTVTFVVPNGTSAASVYWSTQQGAGYEELPAIVQGATAVAQVMHFGRGFAGPPCGTSASAVCTPRRDVTGNFQTVFWTDDGRKTVAKSAKPGATISALVAGANGYQRFPGAFAPDGSTFTIHAVPAGHYFLQIEGMPGQQGPILYDLTTSTPDLSSVVSYRYDLARATSSTPVTLNVSNLDPWLPGTSTLTSDRFEIASSQANLSMRPWVHSGGPAPGATSSSGTFDWRDAVSIVADNAIPGLPDASKGDVVWFYQAKHQSIGTGAAAAVYLPATKAARLSNLTLRDGVAATIDVPLTPVPQSGSMTVDVRYTQFAALAPQVGPSATIHEFSLNVFAIPHGSQAPDMPQDSMAVRPLLLAYDFTTGSASLPDTNYGNVPYGQFSDQPLWQEYRQTLYFYDLPISAPGVAPATWLAFYVAQEPMSSAPIAPALGPVRTPQVNGRSLLLPQSGVGLQPTISWTPPALGAATSVVVNIVALDASPGLMATVRSGNSFTVPPGVLGAGRPYVAILTAQQAPWDGADAPPLRRGVPFYSMDFITSTFTP